MKMQEETEKDVCSSDPWLVLHKIESPTKMRYVGERFAACTSEGTGTIARD